jgi:hypothetical protein
VARSVAVVPQSEHLHIVVTCANRKREPVPDRLCLRDVADPRPGLRFATWTRRLSTTSAGVRPAQDLYAGEHWQVARTLADFTPHRPTSLWVCSAGYGLIPAACAIPPYSATFAPGEPDSVGATRTKVQDWWSRLTEWAGPAARQPRSFAEVARRDPSATLVVVLSAAYQRACAKDVLAASESLRDGHLSVVGPPGVCAELSDLVVPVSQSLRHLVGGSMQSLNARSAAHFLQVAGPGDDLRTAWLREVADRATRSAPRMPDGRRAGLRLSDEEVRRFVQGRLTDSSCTATRLLRELRQSGQSCEQSRFRRLFADVADTLVGV